MPIQSIDHLELLATDFDGIYTYSAKRWLELDGSDILITGGTGFFGSWLSHTLLWVMKHSTYRFKVKVLCRNPEQFLSNFPYFKDSTNFEYISHDIVHPIPSNIGSSHIIHAATTASATLNSHSPLEMIDTIVNGTRNVLEYAVKAKTKRLLFASSGAIYGKIPFGTSIKESDCCGPDTMNPKNAYAEAKRLAELLCSIYSQQHDFPSIVLRCFAFVGPFMSFQSHFAIGNFIDDCIQSRPIQIKGDERTMRSYMYGADLAGSILSLLSSGISGEPINVGSDSAISIGELAHTIKDLLNPRSVVNLVENRIPPNTIDWYIPDISRLKSQYELPPIIPLDRAIKSTGRWLKQVTGR